MEKTVVSHKAYTQLIGLVSKALSDGMFDAQRAVEQQRLKTYWTIGRTISDAVAASDGQLELTTPFYARLSKDIQAASGLTLKKDTIRRSIQFSNTYQTLPKPSSLTFTHYLTLMRIKDDKERKKLEQEAARGDWSVFDLKERVRVINGDVPKVTVRRTKRLRVKRGEPYVYRVYGYPDLEGEKRHCVDCGFKINLPLDTPGITHASRLSLFESRNVRVVKEKGCYTLHHAKASATPSLYTYGARVLQVVDGDTLDALIDVGFGIQTHQRFRLNSINAPEKVGYEGQRSWKLLARRLEKQPIVVVRTHRQGVYHRWLADVFIKDGCDDVKAIAAEGELLNQWLLDEGLAERY